MMCRARSAVRPDDLGAVIDIGNLRGHAYHEREIDEVP